MDCVRRLSCIVLTLFSTFQVGTKRVAVAISSVTPSCESSSSLPRRLCFTRPHRSGATAPFQRRIRRRLPRGRCLQTCCETRASHPSCRQQRRPQQHNHAERHRQIPLREEGPNEMSESCHRRILSSVPVVRLTGRDEASDVTHCLRVSHWLFSGCDNLQELNRCRCMKLLVLLDML